MGKAIREFILLLVIAGAVYLGMRFTVHTYIVYGPSMQPNFVDNEWIIVDKLSYRFHDPQRGDIIVFKPPFNETKNYIKRIIGLPGEAVEVKGGKTYVYKTDGTTIILDETAYQVEPSAQDFPKRAIPLGQYYVMGDNVTTPTIHATAGPFRGMKSSAKRGLTSGPRRAGDWR